MDAVMLIEEIGPQGYAVLRQRYAGAGARCVIGRDLGCDIVLDDGFVAARHTELTLLEDGRVNVRDLGTKNGTRVDGARVPAETGRDIAQGELIIGRTRLYLRTRHTTIGQEKVFRRDLLRRYRTPLAVAGVAACVGFAAFHQWLDAPPSLLRSATTATLVGLGAIALWTAIWALMSKLNKGRWEVRVHLTIASIAVAFCAWGYWLGALVAYAAQWRAFEKAGVAILGLAALAALYLHFREATHYGRRISLALAACVTAVICAVAWVAVVGVDVNDVNRVELGPDVRLETARVVPNRDIADYLADVDKLQREAGRERQKSLLDAPLADVGE